MEHLDFLAFDADNHYYEAEDAFIRHVPKDMQKRCMQWAHIGGKKRLLVGGAINRFIPNPTFDPVSKPGALQDYFRGNNKDGIDLKTMFGELDPISERPEYRDRDARLAVMDEQRLEAAFFFPTLGVGMQASLEHDIPAVKAAFEGFNKWMLEDWGFNYKNRIFAAPVISLVDVEWAVGQVEWALDNGAQLLCMLPGPVPLGGGQSISPAMEMFDPVWSRINEAGVTVGMHGGDGGLMQEYLDRWEPTGAFESFRSSAFRQVTTHERQIFDTMAALVCHGLFSRHPKLRIASIENGGMFVPNLVEELKIGYAKMPTDFQGDPVEQFCEHVWVSPYYEDDIDLIKEHIGADHMLFGSDYPHAEGLEDPTDYILDIPNFSEDEVKKIMRDNAWELVTPAA